MGHWTHCCMPSRTIHTQSIRRKGYRTNQQLPFRLTLVAQIKQLPGTNRSQIVKRPKLKFHLSIKHDARLKVNCGEQFTRERKLFLQFSNVCAHFHQIQPQLSPSGTINAFQPNQAFITSKRFNNNNYSPEINQGRCSGESICVAASSSGVNGISGTNKSVLRRK